MQVGWWHGSLSILTSDAGLHPVNRLKDQEDDMVLQSGTTDAVPETVLKNDTNSGTNDAVTHSA